ncbi:MAG TPA: hypothetical protein VMI09_00370 [Candidatus Binataceae bacterium]|nr:hypothetical protein [Candidatus Binataceae bacterium]
MRQHNPGVETQDSFTASDLILPSQFFELVGKSRFTSEQRLMLAVLADAINILQDWRGSFSPRKRRLFIEAARWVMARGSHVPFSFDNVCDALEISPEALRHRLSALAAGTVDSPLPVARLRLKEAGRLQHMTVNRSRRVKRPSALQARRA